MKRCLWYGLLLSLLFLAACACSMPGPALPPVTGDVLLSSTLAPTIAPSITPTPVPTLPPTVPPNISFPRQTPPEGERDVMEALLFGNLVEFDGCVRVEAADIGAYHLPVWPPSFYITLEDGVIQVHDGSGDVVARVGDWVRMGGGETKITFLDTDVRAQIPDRCAGPYWIVGNEVAGVSFVDLPQHSTIAPLLDALAQQGFALDAPEQSHAIMLYPEPGIAYRVAEGWLHLHLFPDAQITQVRADSIAHELPHPIIDWAASPHFFRCEAVIALYLGDDARVIEALAGFCGESFAP